MTRKDRQLGLFEDPRDEPTRAVVDPELVELAKRLPPHVSFGTSSWTFPGWKGLVYEGDTRMAALTKSGLAAYAKHPLFRAVGMDRSYYAPVPEADLAAYASQLPPDFLALSKVWDEVTTYVFPITRATARAQARRTSASSILPTTTMPVHTPSKTMPGRW